MSALDALARSLFCPFWDSEIANAPRSQGDDEHARTRSAHVYSRTYRRTLKEFEGVARGIANRTAGPMRSSSSAGPGVTE